MGGAGDDAGGALVEHRLGGGAEGAGGVDHVVDQDRGLALHVADDVADLGDLLGGPLLFHDGPVGADLAGEVAGDLDAAGVGADDHQLLVEVLVDEPLGEHRHRGHVVDGDLEEALDLAGVEIHGEDAVGADRLERLGDDSGGDRLARQRLLVLAGVAVPGHDGDDPVRGGALRGVDHAEQLHQRVVRRHPGGLVGRGRLDDEDVGAADRLLVAAVDLAVGEGPEVGLAEVDVELAGDLRGEAAGGAAAEHHQALAVVLADRADRARRGIVHVRRRVFQGHRLGRTAHLSSCSLAFRSA